MMGKDHDPVLNRIAKMLADLRPGPGEHLSDEQISAFTEKSRVPRAPIPEHLAGCPWCWRRVFEARRSLAVDAARPRPVIFDAPIEIQKGAVRFLSTVPGLQPVYAFSSPDSWTLRSLRAQRDVNPGMPAVYDTWAVFEGEARTSASEAPYRSEAVSPAGAPSADVESIQEELFQLREHVEAAFKETEATFHTVHENIERPRRSAHIPLPLEGVHCHLHVTCQDDTYDFELSARLVGTSEPAGAVLTLRRGEQSFQASTEALGIAEIRGLPVGRYDLSVEVNPVPPSEPPSKPR